MNLRFMAMIDQYNARLADVARLPRSDRHMWIKAEEARWVEKLAPHATAELRAGLRQTTRQIMADGFRQARRVR